MLHSLIPVFKKYNSVLVCAVVCFALLLSLPSQEAWGHFVESKSNHIEIRNESYETTSNSQRVNTGAEVTIRAELVNLSDVPLKVEVSFFSDSISPQREWQVSWQDNPAGKTVSIYDLPPDEVIPLNVVLQALYPGTSHVHLSAKIKDQLNLNGNDTVFSRGTTFQVSGEPLPGSKSEWTLKVRANDQELPLRISSSSIVTDFIFIEEQAGLGFKISRGGIPSGMTLIHVSDVLEGPYTVIKDGQATVDYELVSSQSTGESLIRINHDGTEELNGVQYTVIGTRVVPEFGSIVIAVTVVSAFIAAIYTTRARNSSTFFSG
jgi:hypothetical protein